MLNDKDIKKTFLDSSLEDESWLEPSGAVFDNIEQAIYANDESKQHSWLFWIAGVAILAILALSVFVVFGRHTYPSSHEKITLVSTDYIGEQTTENIYQPNQESSESTQTPVINKSNGLIASQRHAINADQRNVENSSGRPNDHSPTSVTNNTISNSLNIKLKSTASSKKKIIDSSFESGVKRSNQLIGKVFTGSTQMNNQRFNNVIATPVSLIEREKTAQIQLEKFSTIPTIQPALLSNSVGSPELSSQIIEIANGPFGTNLSYGVGVSLWNFILNDNYNTALDRADFSHDLGQSISFHLGLEKQVSNNLSFKLQATYDNVKFRSGHNSNISYDPNAEDDDLSNNFDLMVATPIGIIQNQITVGRNQSAPQEEQDLLIVLDNNHEFKNIDLTLSSLFDLYKSSHWNLNTELGLGASYSFGFQNELSEVLFDQNAYSINNVIQSTTQSSISTWRPHVSLGATTSYKFKSGVELGMSYMYKNDLNSIFGDEDFSTRLVRHQFFLSSKKKF